MKQSAPSNSKRLSRSTGSSELPSSPELRETMSPLATSEFPETSAVLKTAGGRGIALLVSVRSIEEARLAADCGVNVIDFKEPLLGPLAPVSESIWQAATRSHFGSTLSAALGEADTASELASRVPFGFQYAKVGPSGTQSAERLADLWSRLPLDPRVELVPVAYADHQAANCVDPHQVLDLVIQEGRSRLLIDTFVKDGRGLLEHLELEALSRLLQHARDANVWIALAGSLRLADVQRIADRDCLPDCVGVRGDVCEGPATALTQQQQVGDNGGGIELTGRRTGRLCRSRVETWQSTLRQLA